MAIYNDERDADVGEEPNIEQLEFWTFDGVCEASDGCMVEPDGICEHGHKSWLLILGYV